MSQRSKCGQSPAAWVTAWVSTRHLSRSVLTCLLLAVAAIACQSEQQYAARGIVLSIDPGRRSLVVSCDAIPNYMDAMEMQFRVRDGKMLAGLKAGTKVGFVVVKQSGELYADAIKIETSTVAEPEPMEAAGLSALNRSLHPEVAAKLVAIGLPVPDFALTDQTGSTIHLSDFRGKTVVLTFGYSRCPNPDYCYRLSHNLAQVEKRLHEHAARNLVLLTIAIDPEHDNGAALARYAAAFRADPAVWHFLTGSVPQIREITAMFGMNFWSQEGLITHTLHTVIVDRSGRLAANLEGNQFSAKQLTDLVQTVMNRPQ